MCFIRMCEHVMWEWSYEEVFDLSDLPDLPLCMRMAPAYLPPRKTCLFASLRASVSRFQK
jgi:hypothetical protein